MVLHAWFRGIDTHYAILALSKYVLEGVVVALISIALPSNFQRPFGDVAWHAVITTASFLTLDTFAPWMAQAARTGVGTGIGANLVGFPRSA